MLASEACCGLRELSCSGGRKAEQEQRLTMATCLVPHADTIYKRRLASFQDSLIAFYLQSNETVHLYEARGALFGYAACSQLEAVCRFGSVFGHHGAGINAQF
jgi:hypothetical protein